MPKRPAPKTSAKAPNADANTLLLESQPLGIRNILMCALQQPKVTLQNLHNIMLQACDVAANLTVYPWDKILFEVTNDKKLFPLFLYQLRTSAPTGDTHKEHVTTLFLGELGLIDPVSFNNDTESASDYLNDDEFGVEVIDPFTCGVLEADDDEEGHDRHFEVLSCSPAAFTLRLVIEANKNPMLQRDIVNAGFRVLHSGHLS